MTTDNISKEIAEYYEEQRQTLLTFLEPIAKVRPGMTVVELREMIDKHWGQARLLALVGGACGDKGAAV